MPLFAYKARSQRGEAINGVIEAANSDTVANQLMADGMTPVDIYPAESTSGRSISLEDLFPTKIALADLVQFSRQMHSLMRAGVPILSALNGISNSTKNETFKQTIDDIVLNLESGRDLATCMNLHEKVFNIFYVSMIRIGETTGKLDEIFKQLAQYLERDNRTRLQIKKAIRYPVFVMIAITMAIIVLNILVIPTFVKVFEQFGSDLPWMTTLIFGLSNFTLRYWPQLSITLALAFFGLRYYMASKKGRYQWDKMKLKLPLVGGIIHQAVLARFARLFSMASRAGVPLITALNVVSHALGNSWLEEKVMGMQSGIERGDSISRTASASGIFDNLVLQMISIGEESGTIDELLEEVATYYDSEVEYAVDKLASSIEPLLTVVIGLIVLVLAMGVFLPMWELSTIQTHRN